jgi:hypothetical protein
MHCWRWPMGRTPAAELARIKVTYRDWRIARQDKGFAARHRDSGRVLRSRSIAELEILLSAARHPHPGSGKP